MSDSDQLDKLLSIMPPAHVAPLIAAFANGGSTATRVAAVEAVLGEAGQSWRAEVGSWVADLLSVHELIPESYRHWRPLVRDCMAFVAAHMSNSRLASKIVEQIEVSADTPVEVRLGLIIAMTPGLQKLGQVLARTRQLSPSLRRELQKLENGISDVTAAEISAVVLKQLGACTAAYDVHLAPELLCEASVSAVLEFTWLNHAKGRREEGVFKVMKPHVPVYYAEDLRILQDLAEHLASKRHDYGFAINQVAETLDEVRLLLEREVDFRREQATLAEVRRVYPRSGAHAPKPIPELCTDTVTAMSVEHGVKVTEAYRREPLWRRRVARQIVQALIADPIFSPEDYAVFHADPHAGNLLYNQRRKELVVLDWALTGRLSRDERRHIARLILMMTFRDAAGVAAAIRALSRGPDSARDGEIIDSVVRTFFAGLPHATSLGALDAMRLLERIGLEGVRFPGNLVLLRKVLFTLDGVLHDIAGDDVRIDTIVASEFLSRWFRQFGWLPSPFNFADCVALQRSALFYVSGLWSV